MTTPHVASDPRVDYPYKSNDPVMRCVPLSLPPDLPSTGTTTASQLDLESQVRGLLSLRVRQSDICAWLGITRGEVKLIKGCVKDD